MLREEENVGRCGEKKLVGKQMNGFLSCLNVCSVMLEDYYCAPGRDLAGQGRAEV